MYLHAEDCQQTLDAGGCREAPIEQEKARGPVGTMIPHSQPPEGGSPTEQEKARGPAGTMIPHSQLPDGGSPTEQEKARGPVGTMIPHSQYEKEL